MRYAFKLRSVAVNILLMLIVVSTFRTYAQQNIKVILSPGYMGANAFPVPRVSDARVGENKLVELSLETHWEFSHEISINPRANALIPWGSLVALKILFEPFEYYNTSNWLKDQRYASSKNGFAKGDIYFGALFNILHQPENNFYLALNFLTKTASGNKLEDARHFNSPGYIFDLTAQQELFPSFMAKITLSGYLAFLAWQSQFNQQNDAVGFAVKVQSPFNKIKYGVEYAAYFGWQKKKDRPMVLRFEGILPQKNSFDLFVRYSYGLQDQIKHSLAFGSTLFF